MATFGIYVRFLGCMSIGFAPPKKKHTQGDTHGSVPLFVTQRSELVKGSNFMHTSQRSELENNPLHGQRFISDHHLEALLAQAHVDGPPSFTPENHQLVYPPKSTIQTTQMDHQTLLNRGFQGPFESRSGWWQTTTLDLPSTWASLAFQDHACIKGFHHLGVWRRSSAMFFLVGWSVGWNGLTCFFFRKGLAYRSRGFMHF